jgi:hypothetical protein
MVSTRTLEAQMPAQGPTLPVADYSIADKLWPAEYGHARALVRVDAASDAVRVRIPWRRRDPDPGAKDIIVIDGASGKRVANVARIEIRREYGDIAFQAVHAG